jgi:hypothetical protein
MIYTQYMLRTIKTQRLAQAFISVFLLFFAWWIIIQLNHDPFSFQNQLFGATYGIMALFGAVSGIFVARRWGYARSLMGKAILMFSLGLLAQEFGQLVYSYYTFFTDVEVPYPSLGDVGYFGSIPLYIYGVVLLGEASGINVTLKSLKNVIQAILIPVILLTFSYSVFLQGYEFDVTNPLVIFLDFGYPFGQAIYVALALSIYLLSRNILGGVMRMKIFFILFALVIQYLSDYTFLYQASRGLAYPGGIIDGLYLVSYAAMGLGLLQLRVSEVRSRLKG